MKTEIGKEGIIGMNGTGNTKRDFYVLKDGSVLRLISKNTALTILQNKHNKEQVYMIYDQCGKFLCKSTDDIYEHDCMFGLYCGKVWKMVDVFNKANGLNGYGLQQETD